MATWSYVKGYLIARGAAGNELARWTADPEMGAGLVVVLNQLSGLSELLLPPGARKAEPSG